jgi:hypothetical protein
MKNIIGTCGDLKVPALLLGYTKFCCFLCDWDSKDKNINTSKNSGINENHLFQDRKVQ